MWGLFPISATAVFQATTLHSYFSVQSICNSLGCDSNWFWKAKIGLIQVYLIYTLHLINYAAYSWVCWQESDDVIWWYESYLYINSHSILQVCFLCKQYLVTVAVVLLDKKTKIAGNLFFYVIKLPSGIAIRFKHNTKWYHATNLSVQISIKNHWTVSATIDTDNNLHSRVVACCHFLENQYFQQALSCKAVFLFSLWDLLFPWHD